MSQENVEFVKIAYEAFATGGLDRFMEHFARDVDYRAFEGAPDDRGPMHGKAAVRAWLQDWIDMFYEFRMELVELVDVGEDTLVIAERYGGTREAQRSRHGFDRLDCPHHLRRKNRPRPRVSEPRAGSRSRRAFGEGQEVALGGYR